jgi:dUTP pyrophosphatase
MSIQTIKIKVKKLHPDAKIPTQGSEYAAGFDIYSIEDKTINPGEVCPIQTGIAVEIPLGKVLHIWDRSGMGMRGLKIHGGVVDSDYRGEIKAILVNNSNNPQEIKKGDRVCQGVIIDYYQAEIEEAEELSDTKRGEKWNNSTGR